ncbi:Mds3p ASCRUDRAFT_150299 [Ascoidea rubescens DSM 1968]|uniref:Uncharacterized protein n=1 Tax=Ascoidea rubescens DSM 1968 TaxID=1344418 RepID=A0A1D2VGS7_9ASCO|nr:hypothetical protein ASCRUDRAFT_150299 [Ascoidea rubescens DSM 1968]ODV60792.1 hypothetical protein ASCRUDRAFT_150299 [Ascoidea rubescens DSM 1968]
MPPLILSPSLSYPLELPSIDENTPIDPRKLLQVRTGASTFLYRSNIFLHGGLTIPLNDLYDIKISEIENILINNYNYNYNNKTLNNINPLFASNYNNETYTQPRNYLSYAPIRSNISSIKNQSNFASYAHYAAPISNLTSLRSIFPPVAITLGRNAFTRFCLSISDFQFVSADGDTIPIPLYILRKRWGRTFDTILARSYSRAVALLQSQEDKRIRETDATADKSADSIQVESNEDSTSYTQQQKLIGLYKSTSNSSSTYTNITNTNKSVQSPNIFISDYGSLSNPTKNNSEHQNLSNNQTSDTPESKSAKSHPKFIIPPKTNEPTIPMPVPSELQREQLEYQNQKMSLLSELEKVGPVAMNKRESNASSDRLHKPYSYDDSSRASSFIDNLSSNKITEVDYNQDNVNRTMLLGHLSNLNQNSELCLEPLLIPRSLYLPFSTSSVYSFAEYFFTGQVNPKWLLTNTLDLLMIAKFYELPLLYDLISEILYVIIGRKESYIKKYSKVLSDKYFEIFGKRYESLNEFFEPTLAETEEDFDMMLLKKMSSKRRESRKRSELKQRASHLSTASTISLKKKLGDSKSMDPRNSYLNSDSDSIISKDDEDVDDDNLEKLNPQDPIVEDKKYLENHPYNLKQNDNSLCTDDDISSSDSDDFEIGLGLADDIYNTEIETKFRCGSIFSGKQSVFSKSSDYFREAELYPVIGNGSAATVTLENLASSNSPAPSFFLLQYIYETGCLGCDVRLMVRSMNILDLAKRFNKVKVEVEDVLREEIAKEEEAKKEAMKKQEEFKKKLKEEKLEQQRLEKVRRKNEAAKLEQEKIQRQLDRFERHKTEKKKANFRSSTHTSASNASTNSGILSYHPRSKRTSGPVGSIGQRQFYHKNRVDSDLNSLNSDKSMSRNAISSIGEYLTPKYSNISTTGTINTTSTIDTTNTNTNMTSASSEYSHSVDEPCFDMRSTVDGNRIKYTNQNVLGNMNTSSGNNPSLGGSKLASNIYNRNYPNISNTLDNGNINRNNSNVNNNNK